jgi:DNA-binding NtrC family response regulator
MEHLACCMAEARRETGGDPRLRAWHGRGSYLEGRPSATGEYREARERVLAEFELGYLARVVRRAGGNMSDAAKIAGVDRTTLYRLMQKHAVDRKDFFSDSE